MAIDYTGMFTGERPNPSAGVAGMPRDLLGQTLQGIQQGEQRAQQALGGMFGTDFRSPAQQVQEQLKQLNPNSTTDQPKIVELLKGVDPQASFAMEEKFRVENAEINTQKSQSTALLRMARAQGNKTMEQWILAGGDLQTAASALLKEPQLAKPEAYATMYEPDGSPVRTAIIDGVLHRATEDGFKKVPDNNALLATVPKKDKPTAIKAADLSKSDVETYDAILNSTPDLEALVKIKNPWYQSDDINEDKKRILYAKAEDIYTNNPKLGRQGALAQAANVVPDASVDTSTDKFSVVTEEEED